MGDLQETQRGRGTVGIGGGQRRGGGAMGGDKMQIFRDRHGQRRTYIGYLVARERRRTHHLRDGVRRNWLDHQEKYSKNHRNMHAGQGGILRSRVGNGARESSSRQEIQIASLNIWLGRARGIEAALRALQQGNFGIWVFYETKLTEEVYTRHRSGYSVWVREAESRHWGGIIIAWQREEGWQLEGVTKYGPDMFIFTIIEGWRKWYIMRCMYRPMIS